MQNYKRFDKDYLNPVWLEYQVFLNTLRYFSSTFDASEYQEVNDIMDRMDIILRRHLK